MPSNHRVRLSPEADDDLTAILEYTLAHWDEHQMNEHADRLFEALGHLAMFPDMGRPRDELAPGLRSFSIDDHIVFYRVTAMELIVRRIVHSRRDLSQEVLD